MTKAEVLKNIDYYEDEIIKLQELEEKLINQDAACIKIFKVSIQIKNYFSLLNFNKSILKEMEEGTYKEPPKEWYLKI